MDLRKRVRRFMAKIRGDTDTVKQMDNLDMWKKRFRTAYNEYDLTQFDRREKLYLGSRAVFSSDRQTNAAKKARNVHNVGFEIIESQVDTQIPQPSVRSKRRGFGFLAKMIEDSIKNDLPELNLRTITDENERNTPVHGLSLVQVNWNPDYKHHLYRGEIELQNLHPKQLIPQPNVWDLQKMDYFFILSSVTRDYIKRRYGVDLDADDGEEYPEINTIDDEQFDNSSTNDSENGNVTEIVCWYRDEDGDIGKFVWCNDTVLEDLPKFFYRRKEVCAECGANRLLEGIEQEVCSKCGSKKWQVKILEYESIEQDMVLEPIVYTKKRKQIVVGEDGQPQVKEQEEQVVEQRIIPAGTQIPYFVPSRYPIAVRINVPQNFKFGGQSDIDVIQDQLDSIKKAVSRAEEKIFKSGALVLVDDTMRLDITNELYQVVRCKTQHLVNGIRVEELTADIQKELEFAQRQYQAAKDTIGITESFQGKYDPSAKSGRAKEIQVQQTAGRLASKLANKYNFYKELYEIIFEFKLAFYDELRPFVRQNSKGEDDWGDFNKYEFLIQDSTGEWYYNTDFIFSADAGQGIPNDKMWLFDVVVQLYQMQALNIVQFWTILEELHFPHAGMIVAQLKEELEQQEQMMEQQMLAEQAEPAAQAAEGRDPLALIISQLPPDRREEALAVLEKMAPEDIQRFYQLPPEEMAAALAEALGEGGTNSGTA